MTERKDGRLMGRIYISKGKYKYVYARSEEELKAKLIEEKTKLKEQKQKTTLSDTMLLCDYLDYYIDNIARLKDSSKLTYKPYIEEIKKSSIAHKKVGEITLNDFNTLMRQMPSNNAKKQMMNILKPSFDVLKKIGIIEHNYTVLLYQSNDSKVSDQKNKYISYQDMNCILSYARTKADAIALIILYFSGIRIGELCALTSDDYDGTYLRINKQLTMQGDITTPKSKKSNRMVACCDTLKEKLDSYLATNDFNFGHMRTRIKSILDRASKDVGSYSVHDFRHTFATNCFLANKNPKVVQKELGHNSYEMTINTYTHLPQLSPKDLATIKRYFS